MDATDKFELFAGYMSLEPAEEHTPAQPAAVRYQSSKRHTSEIPVREQRPMPASAYQRAPCGSSPAELRSLVAEPHTSGQLSASEVKKNALGVSYAAMPGGKRIALLKTLLTSACERNCYYCPFRAGRDFRRATFRPEEMARAFMQLYQSRTAEGFFLSSGIAGGGMRTQDNLIDTAEILRRKLDYTGYLHLKIMPGAERAQVERMMALADRVSVNLEAPNAARLARLAPSKVFIEELLRPLQWVEEIRRTQPSHLGWRGKWPSSVTQFVVGGADESDLEIMSVSAELYKRLRLSRVYYSAFHPVMDTPLENHPAENPWREFRLYQSSFLLRDYGFDLEDLPFMDSGNLPLEIDPKIAWAQHNLTETPVEVNKADRQTLLRVPGIGPKGVNEILAARRRMTFRNLRDLQKTGVLANRAAPFVLLDGRRPAQQLSLW
ncbi:MAG: radical SAM protein [Chloroflexi bacterium]|nr:radical SAM protein [Chloroflexota bacterium]MCL5275199.1 radical SAM protein [Chloroflexota bacterium]